MRDIEIENEEYEDTRLWGTNEEQTEIMNCNKWRV